MTEDKRYVAIPETVSYNDTATDEILCLKVEKDYYEVLSLLNHFHDAWFDVHEGLEQISKEYDELAEENKNLSKLNKILEGFLLDKGYDFNDIIKFLQERTDGKGDLE